ncbi:MAG: hypothetical protein WB510_15090 [Candidatus Sulfotelmatobacter sp.]
MSVPQSRTESIAGMAKPRKSRKAEPHIVVLSSDKELSLRERLYKSFDECPIPKNELFTNLGLFLNRQTLSRILFMHELYQKIVTVHGIVVEFGTRWGQNLALFSSFRGMYEPFNYTRKIVGFDTFEGFTAISSKDKRSEGVAVGGYGVSRNYEEYLEGILTYHEQESPLAHIRKYQLVKGDVTVTLPRYLNENPETMIALAYFDLDLYEPTRKCLEFIQNYVTRGSVLAFDELNHPAFPGETVALREVLALQKYKIIRSPLTPAQSYLVIE